MASMRVDESHHQIDKPIGYPPVLYGRWGTATMAMTLRSIHATSGGFL